MSGAAGALLLAVALLGCGGGDGSASVPRIPTVQASTLSKAAFLKRATALCERVREEALPGAERYFKRHGLRLKQADITSHADELFDDLFAVTYQREVDGIRALGAPRGDEERVTAILNAILAGIEAGRNGEALAFFIDKSPFRRALALAGPYGLGPCVRG